MMTHCFHRRYSVLSDETLNAFRSASDWRLFVTTPLMRT